MKRPIVIGLTGSIGMGKSTVTQQFAALGAITCNADMLVHQLLSKGGDAVKEVEKHFQGVVKNGAVDRQALGKIVFADESRMHVLEKILHPRVIVLEEECVLQAAALGAKFIVLDIPLLFETRGEERVDMTVVVSAPPLIQRQRVMARPNMTEEKFASILAKQMHDSQKRDLADVVIATGLGKAHSFRQVKQLLQALNEA